MIFSRAFFALVRRNWLYRRRFWLGSLLELLLPVAFVGILVSIKNAAENVDENSLLQKVVPAFMPSDAVTWSPLSFADYVTAMQAQRQCKRNPNNRPIVDPVSSTLFGEDDRPFVITGIPRNGFNWQVPFVKCDSFRCTEDGQDAIPFCEFAAIAVSGASKEDTGGAQRATDFTQWLYHAYPVLAPQHQTNQNYTSYTSSSSSLRPLPFQFDFVQFFDSPMEMDRYVQSKSYGFNGPKLVMGIVFHGNDTYSYKYSLRQNSTNFNAPEAANRPAAFTTPDTKRLFSPYARTDFDVCGLAEGTARLGPLAFSCTGQYMYNGVLTFQKLMGDYIMNRTGAAEAMQVDDGGVRYVQFPTKAYEDSGFYSTIRTIGPLLVTMGFLYPVASMISYIAREKELRQKELMKMMSVKESDIGLSWFVTFLLFNIISATLTTGMSMILYESSQASYLFLFWIMTFLAVTVFSMSVAAISPKATRGVLIGLLLFLTGVFGTIAIPINYRNDDGTLIGLITLHPVAAFTYGLQEIGRLEDQGTGLQPNTINSTDNPSGYTFQTTIRSLLFNITFWGFATWYLNRVVKPDYGQAQPLWFPFLPSYWFPGMFQSASLQYNPNVESTNACCDKTIPIEPVSDVLRQQAKEGRSIEILNLRKVFGDKVAVDGLNLSMYNGQITALLGHNGAGKTTTINMLTGALAPTSGTAIVAGNDVREKLDNIRQNIGICLQHDCLFPRLTVREHVQFFSRLKGLYSEVPYAEAEKQVDQAIKDVALFEKRNTFSKNLSGGMKRKLSVAIAFCGGSKVVLLDEPTSGMDPFARRFTWNVIRHYRQGRCIILTTHFMDEADILGDRIAIMAEGRLCCVGSSLFLKKTYGVGYQLTIERQRNSIMRRVVTHVVFDDEDEEQYPDSSLEVVVSKVLGEDNCYDHGTNNGIDSLLMDIIHSSVPEAAVLSNIGSELSFQLPIGAASRFLPLFKGLDEQISAGNINSYGVSITTLEEVFLLVERGLAKQKHLDSSNSVSSPTTASSEDTPTEASFVLEDKFVFNRHICALFKKRVTFFLRDKKAWLCTTVLPSIFVCLGFVVFTYLGPARDLDPLELRLDHYNVGAMPRNPILFNSENVPFSCRPGRCSYEPPIIQEPQTNEIYYFCGERGAIRRSHKCTLSNSTAILDRFGKENEATPNVQEVSNVFQSSNVLAQSVDQHSSSQYASLLFTHDPYSVVDDFWSSPYKRKVFEECSVKTGNYTSHTPCENYGNVGFVLQYNFTALHIAPLFTSLAYEAIIKSTVDDERYKIEVTLDPLPMTAVEGGFGKAEDAFSAWLLVVSSFPFISGAFATFVVTERQSKAKHLQTVAGVNPVAYWLSTYMWDMMNYQIPLWITVTLMFAFDVNILTATDQGVFWGILSLLILYGPASASFTYCITFAFTSPSLCNLCVMIMGFMIGIAGPLTCFILIILAYEPGNERPHFLKAAKILTWFLRFTPPFCLGKGLFNAINIEVFGLIEGDLELNVWSEPILLYEVIFLALQSFVYLIIAVQLDKWSSNPHILAIYQRLLSILKCKVIQGDSKNCDESGHLLSDDLDVIEEERRVLSGEIKGDRIVIKQLTKVYDNGKVAVNGMSLGIAPGECFGLLGINGAGKTTTMAMLTAEFPPTSGDALIDGFSVAMEPEKTRRRIGYCPQFDAHFENLTGREHVELYAAIKGVPSEQLQDAVSAKLQEVGLSVVDSNRLSSSYSGGMKRRLSLACATIGNPHVVFLDECSTGVDPVARRDIWQLVMNMVNRPIGSGEGGTSVILTTHSMEECEALCPRIGIMANGRLRCLGSAQHLKNKFGQGYQIELKVSLPDRADEDFRRILAVLASSKTDDEWSNEDDKLEANDFGNDTIYFHLDEARAALKALTRDDSIGSLVSMEDPVGYGIYRDACSPTGVTLETLTAFVTNELRMKRVDSYVRDTFADVILRERQDTKARYEVSSRGLQISTIFASIEAHKDEMRLADYGVSQTSLEQVFNHHAAVAERCKAGRNDC